MHGSQFWLINPTCFIYMYQIAIIFPIKFPSYQQTLISLDEWYIQQAANWFLYSMVASWFPNNSANISVVWWQRFRVSRSAHEVCITEPEIQKLSMLLEKCRFWYKTKRHCPYSDHYSHILKYPGECQKYSLVLTLPALHHHK